MKSTAVVGVKVDPSKTQPAAGRDVQGPQRGRSNKVRRAAGVHIIEGIRRVQVGRNGATHAVAQLRPVPVGGRHGVSRHTTHEDRIPGLGVQIGDEVLVERSVT